MANFLLLIVIALFYAFCHSSVIVNLKNSMTGFLHYFQIERFYWLYPALWYLEFALSAAVLWRTPVPGTGRRMLVGKLAAICICLLPTLQLLKVNSGMYLNVNQINNGSGITGYISWESWFAEDLMQEIDDAIGRDKSTYRVAHLGISPAPSLMHGFYTVDGYSNNYPLEYKHRFREVIAAELEKNEEVRVYFDLWGNRCYLFNNITGNYMQLKRAIPWCMKDWSSIWMHYGNWDVNTCFPVPRSVMLNAWAWSSWAIMKRTTLIGESGCIA